MNKKTTLIRALIYLVMIAALAALAWQYTQLPRGAESLEIYADGEPAEQGITIYAGMEVQMTYVITPESFADRDISWEIADEKVATIGNDGKLIGVGEGTTTLTADAAGFRVSAEVTVEDPVTSLGGFETDVTVDVGYSYTVEPEIGMVDDAIKAPAATFESDDETIVTVNDNGQITAVGSGTANVTVRAGKLSETIIVRVRETVAPAAPADTGDAEGI